mmetsp:Transcript_12888/g.34269  ORF Transcript_12888/g.34269 Transcript_12888/m.34269 type:complete len:251 (-) Transcript_12888:183-935(-)
MRGGPHRHDGGVEGERLGRIGREVNDNLACVVDLLQASHGAVHVDFAPHRLDPLGQEEHKPVRVDGALLFGPQDPVVAAPLVHRSKPLAPLKLIFRIEHHRGVAFEQSLVLLEKLFVQDVHEAIVVHDILGVGVLSYELGVNLLGREHQRWPARVLIQELPCGSLEVVSKAMKPSCKWIHGAGPLEASLDGLPHRDPCRAIRRRCTDLTLPLENLHVLSVLGAVVRTYESGQSPTDDGNGLNARQDDRCL